MRSNRPGGPGTHPGKPHPASGCLDRAAMLLPVAIVSCGASNRPMDQMMGLQSTTARAVALVAEIGQLPALLRAQGLPRLRGLVDVARAGTSALLALAPKGR